MRPLQHIALVQDLFVSSKELVCGKTDRVDFYTYVWLLSCILIRTPIDKLDLEKSHQRHEVMQHLLTLMDRHTNPYLLHQYALQTHNFYTSFEGLVARRHCQ